MNLEILLKNGFNQYHVKAYETLIRNGMLTASEVSRLGKIPQGRVYNVLDFLLDKGLCKVYAGSVKKFVAVDPEIGLKSLFLAKEKEMEELQMLQQDLTNAFVEKTENSNPMDFFQILSSKESQVSKFDELISQSNKQLISFNKKPYATGFLRSMDEIKRASKPLVKSINNGLESRAIFEAEHEHVDLFIRLIEYYESIGEEVRIVDHLPIKLIISDQKEGMISLKSRDGTSFKLISMIVEHNDLLQALSDLFDLYWEKGKTINEFKKENK